MKIINIYFECKFNNVKCQNHFSLISTNIKLLSLNELWSGFKLFLLSCFCWWWWWGWWCFLKCIFHQIADYWVFQWYLLNVWVFSVYYNACKREGLNTCSRKLISTFEKFHVSSYQVNAMDLYYQNFVVSWLKRLH